MNNIYLTEIIINHYKIKKKYILLIFGTNYKSFITYNLIYTILVQILINDYIFFFFVDHLDNYYYQTKF